MLSVTLRLLSLVALCAAQTTSVSIWVPQPTLPVEPKDLVASIVGSVREPRACLNNGQLTHGYVGRGCNKICTQLRFKIAEGNQLEQHKTQFEWC